MCILGSTASQGGEPLGTHVLGQLRQGTVVDVTVDDVDPADGAEGSENAACIVTVTFDVAVNATDFQVRYTDNLQLEVFGSWTGDGTTTLQFTADDRPPFWTNYTAIVLGITRVSDGNSFVNPDGITYGAINNYLSTFELNPRQVITPRGVGRGVMRGIG